MVADSKDQEKDALPKGGQPSEKVESTSTELWFKENEVKFLAEAEANKRHSALDKQIAEQSKYLGLGRMAIGERDKALEELNQLRAEREKALEEAAKGDTDLFNVAQLRKEAAADRAALAAEKAKLSWSQLEHSEALEEASSIKRLTQVKEICDGLGVSTDEVLSLNPQSLEEAKTLAEKLAKLNTPLPKEPPDSGLGRGGLNLESMTAEEKIRYGIDHPKKTS